MAPAGTIYLARNERGMAWVQTDAEPVVFFRYNDISTPGPHQLVEGEPVEYDLQSGPRGPIARNVRRLTAR